jgi:hypothetical protein
MSSRQEEKVAISSEEVCREETGLSRRSRAIHGGSSLNRNLLSPVNLIIINRRFNAKKKKLRIDP